MREKRTLEDVFKDIMVLILSVLIFVSLVCIVSSTFGVI